jgi:hypothetical protein
MAVGVVGGGLDDLAFAELELHAVEGDALVDGGGVVADDAFDAVFDGGAEDFAVGDVVIAAAGDGFEAFEAEAQIGAGAGDVDVLGFVHELLERVHGGEQGGVVEQADAEEEVLEGLGAHAGLLGHGGRGPAQDDPAAVVDALVLHGAQLGHDHLHFVRGHVGAFGDVVAATHGDVAVGLLHQGEVVLRR